MTHRTLQTCKPDVGSLEQQALARVLASGYFGMGPETEAFERELAAFIGGETSIVCTNTGTSALHLALAALGVREGDEVLVPSLTFVATFQAVAMTRARPVACDVGPTSGLIDLEDARRRLTACTRAVVAVHYAGNPGDLRALYGFAREHGLRVVEDAAHAFGSRTGGALVGGVGDVVCFSFDPIKNITSGQGGAVATRDGAVVERVRVMRNLGIRAAASGPSREAFDVDAVGWRYQMSDLMAGIGRAQLARFERELKPARLALAAAYVDALANLRELRFLDCEADVVPHILPVRLPVARRDAIRAALAARGYETKIHYPPNHLLHAFRDGQRRPACEQLYAELLTLPLHAGVTPADVEAIASVMRGQLAE
jgi:dTDP-4-amino-4,6-dideoxygalactose transaminase